MLTTTNQFCDDDAEEEVEDTTNQIADFQNDSFVIQPDQFMTPDKTEEKIAGVANAAVAVTVTGMQTN